MANSLVTLLNKEILIEYYARIGPRGDISKVFEEFSWKPSTHLEEDHGLYRILSDMFTTRNSQDVMVPKSREFTLYYSYAQHPSSSLSDHLLYHEFLLLASHPAHF